MRRNARRWTTRGPLLLGAAALVAGIAALAIVPALASGHGWVSADAERPRFDAGARALVGAGRYSARYPHSGIKVKVCLKRRFDRRFVKVRCQKRTEGDRSVSAVVGIPGCPKGVWRTTAVGKVRLRSGAWAHRDFARSRTKRC